MATKRKVTVGGGGGSGGDGSGSRKSSRTSGGSGSGGGGGGGGGSGSGGDKERDRDRNNRDANRGSSSSSMAPQSRASVFSRLGVKSGGTTTVKVGHGLGEVRGQTVLSSATLVSASVSASSASSVSASGRDRDGRTSSRDGRNGAGTGRFLTPSTRKQQGGQQHRKEKRSSAGQGSSSQQSRSLSGNSAAGSSGTAASSGSGNASASSKKFSGSRGSSGGGGGGHRSNSPAIDPNWENWDETNLDYDDELMLEKKRQLLQRELAKQMAGEPGGGGGNRSSSKPQSQPAGRRSGGSGGGERRASPPSSSSSAQKRRRPEPGNSRPAAANDPSSTTSSSSTSSSSSSDSESSGSSSSSESSKDRGPPMKKSRRDGGGAPKGSPGIYGKAHSSGGSNQPRSRRDDDSPLSTEGDRGRPGKKRRPSAGKVAGGGAGGPRNADLNSSSSRRAGRGPSRLPVSNESRPKKRSNSRGTRRKSQSPLSLPPRSSGQSTSSSLRGGAEAKVKRSLSSIKKRPSAKSLKIRNGRRRTTSLSPSRSRPQHNQNRESCKLASRQRSASFERGAPPMVDHQATSSSRLGKNSAAGQGGFGNRRIASGNGKSAQSSSASLEQKRSSNLGKSNSYSVSSSRVEMTSGTGNRDRDLRRDDRDYSKRETKDDNASGLRSYHDRDRRSSSGLDSVRFDGGGPGGSRNLGGGLSRPATDSSSGRRFGHHHQPQQWDRGQQKDRMSSDRDVTDRDDARFGDDNRRQTDRFLGRQSRDELFPGPVSRKSPRSPLPLKPSSSMSRQDASMVDGRSSYAVATNQQASQYMSGGNAERLRDHHSYRTSHPQHLGTSVSSGGRRNPASPTSKKYIRQRKSLSAERSMRDEYVDPERLPSSPDARPYHPRSDSFSRYPARGTPMEQPGARHAPERRSLSRDRVRGSQERQGILREHEETERGVESFRRSLSGARDRRDGRSSKSKEFGSRHPSVEPMPKSRDLPRLEITQPDIAESKLNRSGDQEVNRSTEEGQVQDDDDVGGEESKIQKNNDKMAAPTSADPLAEDFSDIGSDDSDEELLYKESNDKDRDQLRLGGTPGKGEAFHPMGASEANLKVQSEDGEVDGTEEGEALSSRPGSSHHQQSECGDDHRQQPGQPELESFEQQGQSEVEGDAAMERISDEELDELSDDEESRAKKKARFADALGVDWSQLVNMRGVQTETGANDADGAVSAARKYWSPAAIFNRIGIAREYLSDKTYNDLVSQIEASTKEGDEKLELLSPIAGLHVQLKAAKVKRMSIFGSSTSSRGLRVFSARQDIAYRRYLCGLPTRQFSYSMSSSANSTSGDSMYQEALRLLKRGDQSCNRSTKATVL